MNKTVSIPKIDTAPFRKLAEAGYQLMPLHSPCATRKNKKGEVVRVGKAPLDNGWPTIPYRNEAVIRKCTVKQLNVGVRLTDDDLILDVDPRNGGLESLDKLRADFPGLNLDGFPLVVTGRDGFHYYGKKPPGLKVNTALAAYPGLDWKTRGTQVVAPGSVHPDALKPYRLEEFPNPPLDAAPQWPDEILEAVKRQPRESTGADGGVHSPAEMATMLKHLNATDFSDEKKWRDLAMACHHATDGEGAEEFIAWSTSDPAYADYEDNIRLRWNSFHTDKPGAITAATLYKALADAGHADAIPKISAEDDFEDYVEPEGDAKKAGKFPLMKLSEMLKLPSPKWLVKGLMIEGGLLEIYGRFKSGKTFWAVEIVCCVATGVKFQDQSVKQGKIIYVIAEGSRKLFAYRMEVWARERSNGDETEFKRLMKLIEENIDVAPFALKIDIAEQVKAFIKENPGDRVLVVIDTLFRTMTGDVTNAKDFSKYVQGCDFIRRKLKTAVLFLHHQKRTDAKGGFGSVVGEASVDVALRVTSPRKMETVLRLDIMRDGDAGVKPWSAKIKVVRIDDPSLTDDEVNTVGVLEFHPRGILAEDVLRVIHADKPESFADIANATDTPKTTIQRYVKQLRKRGLIEADALKLTAAGLQVAINGDDAESDSDDDAGSDFEDD